MSYRFHVLPRAERDAQAIFDYLAARSPGGALRWWEAFEQACERARTQPRSCGLAPEGHGTGYEVRQFLFKTRRGRSYRGLITIHADEVRLHRVRGPGQPLLGEDEI